VGLEILLGGERGIGIEDAETECDVMTAWVVSQFEIFLLTFVAIAINIIPTAIGALHMRPV
jgi:hypothetical protein